MVVLWLIMWLIAVLVPPWVDALVETVTGPNMDLAAMIARTNADPTTVAISAGAVGVVTMAIGVVIV